MPTTTRTTVAAVVILMLALTLTACNGATSGENPTATFGPAVQTRLAEAQRPRPTRTPTPETAAQAATPTPTVSQETSTPTPAAPDLAEPAPNPATEALTLALLNLGDMPEGWHGGEVLAEEQDPAGWTGDDDIFTAPDQNDECGYNYDDPYLNEVSTYFEDGSQDFLIMHQVSLYANDQSADLLLDQIFGAIARCPEVEETYDDGSVSITRVELLGDPQIGDRSGTFQITSSDDDFDYAIAITVSRIGRVVSYVYQFGSLGYSGPVEGWRLHEFATRAAEKIHPLRETFDSLETPPANVV